MAEMQMISLKFPEWKCYEVFVDIVNKVKKSINIDYKFPGDIMQKKYIGERCAAI